MRVSDYIEQTNAAASPEEVFGLFRTAMAAFGYDNIAFAAVTAAAQGRITPGRSDPALVVSCPQPWIDRYVEEKYQEVDPCLLLAPNKLKPYSWAETLAHENLSAKQRRMFAESREAGLNNGLSIPVHGPAGESYVVSLASGSAGNDPRPCPGTMQIFATQLQLAYTALTHPGDDGAQPFHLTDRERECLTWTARGKSAWSISKILGVSEHTVQFHLKTVMKKIGAGNRVQAVVLAIRYGLIAP